MAEYRRYEVDGATVLVVQPRFLFAMRESKIPLGIGYRRAGNGWGVVDMAPWETVPDFMRATPDDDALVVPTVTQRGPW